MRFLQEERKHDLHYLFCSNALLAGFDSDPLESYHVVLEMCETCVEFPSDSKIICHGYDGLEHS